MDRTIHSFIQNHSLESCRAVLYCGAVCFFNFTLFVILENLSILDLVLSGVKEFMKLLIHSQMKKARNDNFEDEDKQFEEQWTKNDTHDCNALREKNDKPKESGEAKREDHHGWYCFAYFMECLVWMSLLASPSEPGAYSLQ